VSVAHLLVVRVADGLWWGEKRTERISFTKSKRKDSYKSAVIPKLAIGRRISAGYHSGVRGIRKGAHRKGGGETDWWGFAEVIGFRAPALSEVFSGVGGARGQET